MNESPSQIAAIKSAIAKACGPQLYLIVKRGLYYRPNGCGYTGRESEAWQLPLDEAKKHEMYADMPGANADELVTVRPAKPLPFWTDLNATAQMEATLTEKTELRYLMALVKEMKESGTLGWRKELTYKATAPQRCRAFLAATGLTITV